MLQFLTRKTKPTEPPVAGWKDLEPAFTDMDGREYRRFPATIDFPLDRHARRSDIITWMSSGLTGKELADLTDIAIAELENLVAGKKGSLVKASAALHEIRNRQTLALHHELMYQFIAVHYIREGEDLWKVNDHIMDDKIEAFKKMVAGGRLLDFFHLPEVSNICNTIGLSSEEFQSLWSESMAQMKVLNQKLQFLKSMTVTTNEGKTSKKA